MSPVAPGPGWLRIVVTICCVPVVIGAGVMVYRAAGVPVLIGALVGLGMAWWSCR